MTITKRQSKRILLVEDEEVILSSLQKVLEKASYEVIPATNGKMAQDLFTLDAFDAVVSDIHMPSSHVSGIELLHFVKKAGAVPVILMTGFATLRETREAHEAGATAFLPKPFKKDELFRILDQLVASIEEPEPEPIDEDELYCKLSIDDFISGRHIQFNVFIRISSSKYIKIAHSGADLEAGKIQAYKDKGIRCLYLLKDDFKKYISFSLGLTHLAKASSTISNQKKIALMKHTGELILENFHHSEVSPEAFDQAKSLIDTTVSFMLESQGTMDLISALSSHSDFLYAHSLGVSLYAVLIAKKAGWHAPTTLYKLSMTGLLHDIGKKEIDREILVKNREALNFAEIQMLETHTTRGAEILARIPSVPGDVLQITLQHHERDSGTGYPSGLTKAKIHPLARMIAVADEFCKAVLPAENEPKTSPKDALQRMKIFAKGNLDAAFLAALEKVLVGSQPKSK